MLAAAQAGFALAESYPLAVVARVFVGVGDALTFICVLRLVSRWFPTRRVPFVTQLTGTLGQLGAVGAAVPMTWALGHWGWTPAYLAAAGLGWASPWPPCSRWSSTTHPTRATSRGPRMSVRCGAGEPRGLVVAPGHPAGLLDALHHPVQRDALCPCCGAIPFLVRGEGRSSHTAGLLLTLMIVAVMVSGPVLGWLVGRHPWHRSTTVLTIVWSIVRSGRPCCAGPAPRRCGCWWCWSW